MLVRARLFLAPLQRVQRLVRGGGDVAAESRRRRAKRARRASLRRAARGETTTRVVVQSAARRGRGSSHRVRDGGVEPIFARGDRERGGGGVGGGVRGVLRVGVVLRVIPSSSLVPIRVPIPIIPILLSASSSAAGREDVHGVTRGRAEKSIEVFARGDDARRARRDG